MNSFIQNLFLFLLITPQFLFAQTTINYSPSTDNFTNPERGQYQQFSVYTTNTNSWTPVMTPLNPTTLEDLYTTEGISLVLRLYYMPAFKNTAISQEYLDLIEEDMAALRSQGMKCILRFAYSKTEAHGHTDDASLSQVLAHITQLTPILQANSDVISVMQAGFMGAYGEWAFGHPDFYLGMPYSGSNKDYAAHQQLIDALMVALPSTRMVQVRTPQHKQEMYTTGTGASNALQLADAFNGSTLARLGHHNDCFLASATDYGTYQDIPNEYPYLAQETRFLAMGGETCNLNAPRSDCSSVTDGQADIELEQFHWSYLNKYYNTAVNDRWQSQTATPSIYGTCFEDILRRLGYRFELQTGTYDAIVEQECGMTMDIRLKNIGYASPFNSRQVALVFRNTSDASEYRVFLDNQDPRTWYKESELAEVSILETVGIPANMPTGIYDIFLHLPAPEASLSDNPRYAIQLSNSGVWESATGYNDLQHQVTINNSVCASPYVGTQWLSDNDAGINSILNPTNPICDGNLTVIPSIEVQNFGSQNMTSLTVNWSVNAIAQTPINWTGNLAQNATTIIDLSSYVFSVNDVLEISLNNPNGNRDINNSNDVVSLSIQNGLSGNYTIGGTSPNYATFNDALNDLKAKGVCGATVFDVRDGIYNEQLTIPAITNASATNNIVFQSQSGSIIRCVLSYNATNWQQKHTLKLDNSSYVSFRSLGIEATNSDYGWTVHVSGNSSHINIENCALSTSNTSISSNHINVILNGSDTDYGAGANTNNCTIQDCTLEGGRFGISAYGTAFDDTAPRNTFKGNTITGFYDYGVRVARQNAVIVDENTIASRGTATDSRGIYAEDVHYVDAPSSFSANRIVDVALYGIQFAQCYGDASDKSLTTNNMIGGGFTHDTPRGMSLDGIGNWDIYHNSINLDKDNGSSTTVCALYIASGFNIDIQNNNFAHTASTGSGFALRIPTGLTLDYNNYYNAAGANVLRIGSTIYTTASFQTGGGSNSLSQVPDFQNATDLHLVTGSTLINAGSNTLGITTDIDGEARPTDGTVDIGADERPTALPLDLLSFTGTTKNGIHELEWETANEIDVRHFEIEQSRTAVNFLRLETILATGNHHYSFAEKVGLEPFYYRLKIVDKDGSFVYSDVIVLGERIRENDELFIYPNPIKENQLRMHTSQKGRLLLQVFDVQGRVVFSGNVSVENGAVRVDLLGLDRGVYVVKFGNEFGRFFW